MRPDGRDRYASLYFDYPKFDVFEASELHGEPTTAKVAIIGAGPVGLVAALELARHGVASVLLDDKTTVNDGSRALCLARHSMETLQQLGLAEKFLSAALGWTSGRSYYKSEEVFRLHMPHSAHERFMPMYNLQQQYIEQYLAQAARATGLVEMRWGNAVTRASVVDGKAHLEVSSAHGDYTLTTPYCIAADGARSVVRRDLGLRLNGDAYEGKYVIADIRIESSFPTERRAFFDPAVNPGATLLVHKQPHGIWRIDWQLQPGESEQEVLAEPAMRKKITAILAMLGETEPWELEWWGVYKAYTLCLDDYRHGPYFFSGDAAHLVPIFGVRGLNSGIADSGNIAWKLACVLNSDAPDALLDSYSPERRGATMEVFENASKSTAFMTPPTRGFRLMRDAVLSLSLRHSFAKPFLNPRQSTPYTYADSDLSTQGVQLSEWSSGPEAGAPLINHNLSDGSYLLDHLPHGFCLLAFVGRDQGATLTTDLRTLSAQYNSSIEVLCICRDGSAEAAIIDADGTLFQRYGASEGSVYLVRPDRHVAARWLEVDISNAEEALLGALARTV